MKQLLLVILLPIMLTACNKTDLFGYESYNHCMLGTVASQPGFKEKTLRSNTLSHIAWKNFHIIPLV